MKPSVDLSTGEFTIQGATFHPYPFLQHKPVTYELVSYTRKRKQAGNDQYIHRFLIGWKCTYQGVTYQRIIFYDPYTESIEIKERR